MPFSLYHVFVAWAISSVLVNVLVTTLISWKLISTRRRVMSALPEHGDYIYRSNMSILIESAAPLAVSGVVSVVFSLVDRSKDAVLQNVGQAFIWMFFILSVPFFT